MKKLRGNNDIKTTPELLSLVDMFHSRNKDDYELARAIINIKSRRMKSKIYDLILKDPRSINDHRQIFNK